MEEKCNDILKLGLLQGDMSPQRAHTGIREQTQWFELPHKIFFDYVMAFFIEKQGEVSIENFTKSCEVIVNNARSTWGGGGSGMHAHVSLSLFEEIVSSTKSKGTPGDTPPSLSPASIIFMQFQGKMVK